MKARVIVNPAARNLPSWAEIQEGALWLEAMGCPVEVLYAHSSDRLHAFAREAAERGYGGVIACGGDGTLSLVADAIAGSDTALCVIPGGTSNVWAREAGIPYQPLAAMRLLLEGRHQRLDLGFVEGAFGRRSFILMAGVGLDAGVIRAVSSDAKRLLGAAAFAIQSAVTILQLKPQETRLIIDGEPYDAQLLQLVLGNTRFYGGVAYVTRDAYANDGAIDLCLYEGNGLPQIASHVAWTLASSHPEKEHVLYRRVREVAVVTPGLPIQVDGDYVGETPATFGVQPACLTVCLPTSVPLPFLAEG
jgi:YegS/Rv2252/BmrU family lipid kinase